MGFLGLQILLLTSRLFLPVVLACPAGDHLFIEQDIRGLIGHKKYGKKSKQAVTTITNWRCPGKGEGTLWGYCFMLHLEAKTVFSRRVIEGQTQIHLYAVSFNEQQRMLKYWARQRMEWNKMEWNGMVEGRPESMGEKHLCFFLFVCF